MTLSPLFQRRFGVNHTPGKNWYDCWNDFDPDAAGKAPERHDLAMAARMDQTNRLIRALILVAWCALLSGCVTLGKRDAFPLAGKSFDLPSLQALVGRGSEVRPLRVTVGDRTVAAYEVRHRTVRGTLVFFGGSGNQIDAAIKGLDGHAKALGLDLAVFSYYQQGEEIPSVTQARATAKAVCDAARATHPAGTAVYLVGHSLGGWFALDMAARENVRGLALVGAETTSVEVIRKTTFPWADLAVIRPDADARQLDASLYAPRVRAPTLVITSHQDEAVPAMVGQELYAMLPPATPKRLVVLDGVTHGRYFLSDEFWRQFADFFQLRPATEPR